MAACAAGQGVFPGYCHALPLGPPCSPLAQLGPTCPPQHPSHQFAEMGQEALDLGSQGCGGGALLTAQGRQLLTAQPRPSGSGGGSADCSGQTVGGGRRCSGDHSVQTMVEGSSADCSGQAAADCSVQTVAEGSSADCSGQTAADCSAQTMAGGWGGGELC